MKSATVFDVDAVAFDLDGTLLDTVDDLAGALNALLAEQLLPALPVADVRRLVGKGMANLVMRAFAEVGAPAPEPDELARLLVRYQALYADQLGRHTRLYPGVVAGLQRLQDAGLALAVVTNKASRFVVPHLRHAGIADRFGVTIGGDDAEAKKPDPAPLRLAARRLGVDPSRLLVVGDSANDAQAARAAGCPVLVVPYGYNEGRPVETIDADAVIGSLRDVGDFVARCGEALGR